MNLQHQTIVDTAQRLGIEIIDLRSCGETNAVFLKLQGQQELLVDGNFLSLLDLQSKKIFDNKQLTKQLFATLKIPSPKSLPFHDPLLERPTIQAFWQKNAVYVCKPLEEYGGTGVVMDISSFDELLDYWQAWKNNYDVFLLEEQKQGYDLRLQAIGGKLAAACIREPAFVIGDGKSSVASLIEARKAIIKRQNPSNQLICDASMLQLLQEQELQLESVPAKDQKVRLSQLANMSLGAVATDVSEAIAPLYHNWVERVAAAMGISLFALDVMTTNHESTDPDTAWGIEINALPEWLHHTFSEGRQHNIARMILADLFSTVGS